jgi:hypothetical protein
MNKLIMLCVIVMCSSCAPARYESLGYSEGPQGPAGKDGSNGSNGVNGTNGINGANGQDGYSVVFSSVAATTCTNGGSVLLMAKDSNRNGVLDTSDTNLQATTICNGVNGTTPPVPPMSIVAVLDPCNDAPGIFDEVLLKMQNGTIVASFSDNASGLNTRFSILGAGSYQTTDGSHCFFSVDGSGNLYNQHY